MTKFIAPAVREAARRAREDVNLFIEYVFGVRQDTCHERIQSHFTSSDRAGVIAQKELGKTTQALARILWEIGRDPDLLIKLVCSSDDAAKDRVMFLRDMIARNARLRLVFPHLRKNPRIDNWGKFSLTVDRKIYSKDASIEAHGVLTQAEGRRAGLILFDDVCDFQNTIKYPNLRSQVRQAFRQVWIPLLGASGRAWYLATKHHEEDLTADIEKNDAWSWIDLSVSGEPPVSPWPSRWDTAALERRKTEIGSIEFDRAYRNILHPDSERIVKEPWVRWIRELPESRSFRILSWDLAAGAKDSDYTARAVVDVSASEKTIRVPSVDKWRGLSYEEMIRKILAEQETWGADEILVESSGFQIIVGRDERLVGLPVVLVVPSVGKVQRVRQTAVWYENGRVLFLDGRCSEAVDELLKFPRGAHDDCVDALTQGILRAIEKMGTGFRPDLASGPGSPRVFTRSSDPSSSRAASAAFGRRKVDFRTARW